MKGIMLVGLSVVLLVGCDDTVRRRNPETYKRWTVVSTAERGPDGCPLSRAYFLKNNYADDARPGVVKQIRNDTQGPTSYHDLGFDTIPGYGVKFLAYSPETVGSGRVCNIEYSWEVDKELYTGSSIYAVGDTSSLKNKSWFDRVFRPRVAASAEAFSAAAMHEKALLVGERSALEGLAAAGGRCRTECTGPGGPGPNCLAVNISERPAGQLVNKFADVLGALKPDDFISAADILAKVGEVSDPCERSGLVVKDRTFVNTGAACEVRSSYGVGARSAKLSMPELVSGQLQASGDELKVVFPRPASYGPALWFEDGALQAEFGGPVSQAELVKGQGSARTVVLTGSKNCVAIRVR